MNYFNDERYWDIKLLNKWFAISSILFLLSIVWLFVDDNDDDYKNYQKEFRKLSVKIAENKLNEELIVVESEKKIYQEKYNQKENYYAIGYENTKDPNITLDIGKQIKIFLDLLPKHDRELLLKSLLLCSIQSDLTYKIQYQALNDLKKQEAELI